MVLSGCLKRVAPPPPIAPPPAVVKPFFEGNTGQIGIGKKHALVVRYKGITVVVDPSDGDGVSADALPTADYVLLTDASPDHFGEAIRQRFRPNQKTLMPPESIGTAKAAGLSQVKGLEAGQRLMLKKSNAFLFCTAVPSRNAALNLQVNGYLLEFDNGRNLFVSGAVTDESALRDFVYSLRDDGRELWMGFFYGGGQRSPRASTADEAGLARQSALVQPHYAIILGADEGFNATAFADALKNEIYDGEIYIPKTGETIPF